MKTFLSKCVVLIIGMCFSHTIYAQDIFRLIQTGKSDSVKIFIDRDPQLITGKDSQNRTLLHSAVLKNNIVIVSFLIEKGAAIDEKDKDGRTPLGLIAYATGNFELAKFLIDKGADINSEDNQKISVLRRAVAKGSVSIVDYLLEKGVTIPSVKEEGGKILFRNSVRNGFAKLVDRMITEGADVNEKDNTGSNLLHYAAAGGSSENIKRLLEAGLKIDDVDNFGWTPLHNAAAGGQEDAAKTLIENGVALNGRTNDGYTAFNLANEIDNKEIVNLLISKGADTNEPKYDRPKGEYFGQTGPGIVPEKFAPGFITRENTSVYACTFSPDGKEFYYTRGGNPQRIMVSRLEKEGWTFPKTVSFSAGFSAHEPHITFDNKKIYWNWFRLAPDGQQNPDGIPYGIYMSERTQNGWSEAKYVGEGMYVNSTKDGNIYVSGIQKAIIDNGRFKSLENILDNENKHIRGAHPAMAPDGSYVLYDEFGRHLYVRFRHASGNWGELVDLTKNGFNIGAGIPYISPDGKYLFFRDGNSLYWVSTKMIEDLKPKEL
jgi:ankyrin repeat protein